jgi:hypothetical protein
MKSKLGSIGCLNINLYFIANLFYNQAIEINNSMRSHV